MRSCVACSSSLVAEREDQVPSCAGSGRNLEGSPKEVSSIGGTIVSERQLSCLEEGSRLLLEGCLRSRLSLKP